MGGLTLVYAIVSEETWFNKARMVKKLLAVEMSIRYHENLPKTWWA